MDIINNRNQHCTNCGLNGHVFRNCLSPVTSYGLIAIRYMNDKNISQSLYSQNHLLLSNGNDSIQFLTNSTQRFIGICRIYSWQI